MNVVTYVDICPTCKNKTITKIKDFVFGERADIRPLPCCPPKSRLSENMTVKELKQALNEIKDDYKEIQD